MRICGIMEEKIKLEKERRRRLIAPPNKYSYWTTAEGLLKLECWARGGLVDKEIADKMGTTVKSLCEWKNKFPAIREALKKGKEEPDEQVKKSLLKTALGYPTVEKKVKKDGNGKILEEVIITREVPPNPTSIIFWLKNRRPNEWREKKEVDYNLDKTKEVDGLSESIKKLVKEGKKELKKEVKNAKPETT